METYFFFFLATLAIASAIGLILSKDSVNSALFLILNLISVAGVYLLLKAQFLAIIQILVYAGAIMVLFLFVIMMLNLGEEESLLSRINTKFVIAFLLGVIVLAQLVYAIAAYTGNIPNSTHVTTQFGTAEVLGEALFTTYMLPVLITAVLLTAAVVGAILLAQRKLGGGDK